MHARRATLIFATQGIGAVSGLVALFFIGRFMSPTSYGAFGFAMGFVGLWMVLADLGLERSHVRHITHGHDLGDCIATFMTIKVATVVLFVLGAGASILVWTTKRSLTDASGLPVLVVVLCYCVFFILRTIPAGTLNALKLTASTQSMVLLEHIVKLPLVIVAALFYGFMRDEVIPFPAVAQWLADHSPFERPMQPDQGGLLLAGAWAIAMLGSLMIGVVLAGRQSFPVGRVDRALLRSYLVFALPVALGASTRILFSNIDAVFIGFFLSAENVGFYFAADRLSALALIVPMALSTVFFPIFGELAAKRDLAVLNELALGMQRALSILMVLIVLLFVIYPAEGITIFLGDPFLPARLILPWLAVYVLLLAFATVATNVIMALGSPYTVVKAGVIALALNAVLNLLLVPDEFLGVRLLGLHSVGAAVATATAQAVGLMILLLDAQRLTGRLYLHGGSLKHIAAALAAGAIAYPLQRVFIGSEVRVWELLFAGSVTVALYGLALVLLRELTRKDLHIVRDALHPRRMVSYIQEELRDKRPSGERQRKT